MAYNLLRPHAAKRAPIESELLAAVAGVDEVLPLHDGTPECAYDDDIELMELAHYFRLTPETIPSRVPYIYEWLGRRTLEPPGAFHIGIAWQSGGWDPRRSISPEIVAELGRIPGVEWHSLQYDADETPLPARRMVDRDLALTARRMRSLDLVISVDTVTAHLAGALALPTWTLLPHDRDWRWLSRDDRSLWYPTMRLFRQPRRGDWKSVIDVVREALTRTVGIYSDQAF